MFNYDTLYKTHVTNSDLRLGLHSEKLVEAVYDESLLGLVPIEFTRVGSRVNLVNQPHGQLYVKYFK